MSNCLKVYLLTFVIIFSLVLLAISSYPQSLSVFGQTQSFGEIKKVQVGDIDVAYKMFGKGDPIILISGYSAPLEFWDSTLLQKLASNHTVIIFDNRGIGNTTSGTKQFSIPQFVEDTSGLLNALGVKKADVMGWSMGGFIAQELALTHPDKVGKLIIYASICGGEESTPPTPDVVKIFSNQSGTSLDRIKRFLPLLFPPDWHAQNPNYLQNLPSITETILNETLNRQTQAIFSWTGTCNRLNSMTLPTLVIVGTDDTLTVPVNSLLITEKIPGAWLVQFKGGGHGLMFQYPDEFSNIVLTFLKSY
jgi:pimeloyl-ACP methyl ester carboxylesterase